MENDTRNGGAAGQTLNRCKCGETGNHLCAYWEPSSAGAPAASPVEGRAEEVPQWMKQAAHDIYSAMVFSPINGAPEEWMSESGILEAIASAYAAAPSSTERAEPPQPCRICGKHQTNLAHLKFNYLYSHDFLEAAAPPAESEERKLLRELVDAAKSPHFLVMVAPIARRASKLLGGSR